MGGQPGPQAQPERTGPGATLPEPWLLVRSCPGQDSPQQSPACFTQMPRCVQRPETTASCSSTRRAANQASVTAGPLAHHLAPQDRHLPGMTQDPQPLDRREVSLRGRGPGHLWRPTALTGPRPIPWPSPRSGRRPNCTVPPAWILTGRHQHHPNREGAPHPLLQTPGEHTGAQSRECLAELVAGSRAPGSRPYSQPTPKAGCRTGV